MFDHGKKKWSIRADGSKFDYQTLGIVASKQHGARAVQLPNHTNKIVAGVVDASDMLSLFSAPLLENG